VASHSSDLAIEYASGEQDNRVAAATVALQKCRAASLNLTGFCELKTMGDTPITSGAAMRPEDGNHPLFLWRLKTLTSTVYLAGSLHLSKASLYPLPAAYESAFAKSKKLVVEVNTRALNPRDIYAKTEAAARLNLQRYLRESFNAADYAQLALTTSEYGVPLRALQSYKPAMIYTQLSVMGFLALGYETRFGLEEYFLKQKSSEDILQLETMDLQLQYLFNQSMEMQIAVLMDTVAQFKDIETTASHLIRAWTHGDDETLAELMLARPETPKLVKQFNKKILDQRNVTMSEKIFAYLDTTETYFILVGAAHLAGTNSIIELLAKKGLNPERIYANAGDLEQISKRQSNKGIYQ
jgi:hypothetical protein